MIQPSNFMYFQIEHVCITYFKSYPRRKCDLKPFWRNFLFRRGSLFMYFYPKLYYCNCNKDILSVMQPMIKILLWIAFTFLPTMNKTSETIVPNLFCPFSCIQGSLEAKTGIFLCSTIKYTIKLFNWMQRTKIKLQIVTFLEFWVVFTVSSFVSGYYCKIEIIWREDQTLILVSKILRFQLGIKRTKFEFF